jgi:hypothetical protein
MEVKIALKRSNSIEKKGKIIERHVSDFAGLLIAGAHDAFVSTGIGVFNMDF